MPFTSSFSVLSGFSRVSERKKEFYYFFFFKFLNQWLEATLGAFF